MRMYTGWDRISVAKLLVPVSLPVPGTRHKEGRHNQVAYLQTFWPTLYMVGQENPANQCILFAWNISDPMLVDAQTPRVPPPCICACAYPSIEVLFGRRSFRAAFSEGKYAMPNMAGYCRTLAGKRRYCL